MPYSIYEQHQQQFLDRRVVFDENNPYGRTEELRVPPHPPPPNQSIYNEISTDNLNYLNNSSINQNQTNNQNSLQPQPPPLPQTQQNGSLLLNGHNNSNLLMDQMSLINNEAQNMNQINGSNNLMNLPSNSNQNNMMFPNMMGNLDSNNVRWRDPDLHEVIEFLNHPNPIVKANAAAYLQHLSFMDDSIKQKARALGSITALINALNFELQLLNQAQPFQQQLNSNNQLQTEPSRDVQRNCLGALRNLSYGRQNDENKRSIKSSNGIFTLVNLLKFSINDKELKELITGILWNLSSFEEIKTTIIDEAVKEIVNYIIIPGSGWDGRVGVVSGTTGGLSDGDSYDPVYGTNMPSEIYWSTVFRNATGVLRNISSAGEYARCKLRECDGLCESLLFIVRQAIRKNDIDNKSIENCVCVLRNLSYRCQEVIDPNYDKHNNENGKIAVLSPSVTRASALIVGKVGDNLGCFGGSRKKKDFSSTTNASSNSISITGQQPENQIADQKTNKQKLDSKNSLNKLLNQNDSKSNSQNNIINHAGMQLLWQPDVVRIYLSLLSECSNPETLEAAAGAIQNLCACYWPVSAEIRAAVRKEKGLPVLVELLRMEVDRVVCAVATALRNLALDIRNKELIGKYAMRDLVSKLPLNNNAHGSNNQQNLSSFDTSDDTIAAVLATLNEVVSKNADFAKSLLEADGMERLLHIVKFTNRYSSRVVKFTSQLLHNMWQHSDLRETYRKAGYKESHFLVKQIPNTCSSNTTTSTISMNSKNSLNSMSVSCSANNTLSRPMSTQGVTKYEDNVRTLPKGIDFHRNLNLNGMTATLPKPRRPSGELQMNDLNIYNTAADNLQQPLMQPLPNIPLNTQSHMHLQQPQQLSQSQQTALAASIYQSSQAVRDEINQLNQMTAGMSVYPSGVNFVRTEPVYAQVNREKKKNN